MYSHPEDGTGGGRNVSMSRGWGSTQGKTIPGVHLDVGDLARFLDWLERAAQSNGSGLRLPDPPAFRDQTVTRWMRIVVGFSTAAEGIEAELRGAENVVGRQVSQLRDQTVQLAEQLAAVCECSDRADEAQAIRLRAAGFSLRA